MAIASNEPYQRVATDNGVFDGAGWGAGIGAAAAGAVIGGNKMHYNGIPKRAERDLKVLEAQEPFYEGYQKNVEDRYARNMGSIDKGGVFNQGTVKRAEIAEQSYRDPLINGVPEMNPDIQRKKNMMDKRIRKAEKRYDKGMDQVDAYQKNLRQLRDPHYVESMQQRHRYSKHMGGWKNAAIIGASAVIGGGVGMIADGLNK